MRFKIYNWAALGYLKPHPEARPGKELSNNYPLPQTKRFEWYVDLEPQEVVELAKNHDVMIVERDGETLIYLDDKNRRFRQR